MPAGGQRGDPGLNLVGMLILTALGTVLWQGKPLESTRPASSAGVESYRPEVPEEAETHRVLARLWHDPFKAIYTHKPPVGDRNQSAEPGVRRRITAVLEAGKPLTILPVMLTPGPYGEVEERRRRRRYAVVSALGEAGYEPAHSDIMQAFSLAAGAGDANASEQPEHWIPYEWYGKASNGGPDRQILLLWLDESTFQSAPFARFGEIFGHLLQRRAGPGPRVFAGEASVDAFVIGPARSSTLRRMTDCWTRRHGAPAESACGRHQSSGGDWPESIAPLRYFQILSPVATVPSDTLRADAGIENSSRETLFRGWASFCPAGSTVASGNESVTSRACLGFLRTIRSDDVVIAELVRELKSRDIDPAADRVAVISEWDTEFGRSLQHLFEERFCAEWGSGTEAPGDGDACRQRVERYTYQRGIDGIAPVGTASSAGAGVGGSATDEADGGNAASDESEDIRRPFGTGQFDYLRRLANDMRSRQADRPIRAVAVLGSDVYDKLLVLQALRPKLPGAIWVTTDVDANFLHPAEHQWTRNLVIGSSFGLQLPEHIQRSTPPFRNSYQTSVFFATRMALGHMSTDLTQPSIYERMPPQVFEVGRNGLLSLERPAENDLWTALQTVRRWLGGRQDGDAPRPVNRVDPGDRIIAPVAVLIALPWLVVFFLFCTGVSLVGYRNDQSSLSAGSRWARGAWGLFLIPAMFTIFTIAAVLGIEPFDWFSGASVWPTEYIRVLAIALGIYFVYAVGERLQWNRGLLGERYFDDLPPEKRQSRVNARWLMLCWGALVLLMVGVRIPTSWADSFEWPLALHGALWVALVGLGPMLGGKLGVLGYASGGASAPKDARQIWLDYGERAEAHHRFLRTLWMAAVYLVTGSVVIYILDNPTSPCRGTIACFIDLGVLLAAVPLLLFLLFMVFDSIQLCTNWIGELKAAQPNWKNAMQPNLPLRHADGWLRIRLIGERTAEVERLVYYPVIVMLLMLLSRSSYFDDWGFQTGLAIVIGGNFAIALGSAVYLNYVAREARTEIVDDLRREELELGADQTADQPEATRQEVRDLINQLEQLNLGAYRRFWDQPVVRATLLLVGGALIAYAEMLRGAGG